MIEKRPGAFAPGRFVTGRIASGEFSALVVTVKSWRPYSSVAVIRISADGVTGVYSSMWSVRYLSRKLNEEMSLPQASWTVT